MVDSVLKLALSALLFSVVTLRADLIVSPVAAPVNTAGENSSSDPIGNTFNQAGLTSGFVSDTTNFATYIAGDPLKNFSFTDEWFSSVGVTSGEIIYDLGATYSLTQIAFWQEDASGVGRVSVSACTDVTCSSAVAMGSFSPAANPLNQYYGPQVFSLTSADAEFVRLTITGPGLNDGYDGLAIGEVAFGAAAANNTSAPEPSSFALLGAGIAGVLGVARFRGVRIAG